MRALSALLILAASGFATSTAAAQSVSGEVGVHSSYLDEDLLPLTPKPVIQGGIYLDISDECSFDTWGSHGFATKTGAELAVGASCRLTISETTKIEVAAYRDFLRGFDDMTELSINVTNGPISVKVTRFIWDNNPDALRVTARYTIDATEKLSFRPSLVYQTGFGEPDVIGGGLESTYALTDRLSLTGTVLTPFAGDRVTRASIGINFSF